MKKITKELITETVSAIRLFDTSNIIINNYAPIDAAREDCLAFCSSEGPKGIALVKSSRAGIIFCYDSIGDSVSNENNKCIITVKNPRLAFARCINKFFIPEKKWDIHPTAIIDESAQFSKEVFIGPNAYIGQNVIIGSRTIIEGGAHVNDNVTLGKNCLVQAGTIVGSTGQGFERNSKNEFEKIPQLGIVILEDNVEIGANSVIVRGTIIETVIGKGSKIGNLSNIGHNVSIGNHVFVSAGVTICGSARIGDHSWLSPNCCIRDYVHVGKNVTVGMGAVVVKDVPKGITVVGNPAEQL